MRGPTETIFRVLVAPQPLHVQCDAVAKVSAMSARPLVQPDRARPVNPEVQAMAVSPTHDVGGFSVAGAAVPGWRACQWARDV